MPRHVLAEPLGTGPDAAFEVHLDVFEGPFDLLLRLIAKHELDVTLVALSQVTDEFLAHVRDVGERWDLGRTTEFLVVAATLLDLKAARLLPAGEVEDDEDVALLEARDLLFARLLQYRAYKQVAGWFSRLLVDESRRLARDVPLDEPFASLLPDVLAGVWPDQLAALAAQALAPRVAPVVAIEHLHLQQVSVREHAIVLAHRLFAAGVASFRALVADCTEPIEVVARFLALLELYREGHVVFEQIIPYGDLQVRWTGEGPGDYAGATEYDAAEPEVDG